MKRKDFGKEILTVPNLMSFFRILLIPLYLWLYCVKENTVLAATVLIVSGISDILDGIIARKFNMVSDFGKFLDPVADKLTQAAFIISLSVRYPHIWGLFVVFSVKELTMGVLGLLVLEKTDTVNSAQWFGKLTTVVLETSMAFLLIFPNIEKPFADVIFAMCSAMAIFSLIMYSVFYITLLTKKERGRKWQKILLSVLISVISATILYILIGIK